MGEVALLADALTVEFGKALSNLPDAGTSHFNNHDTHQLHHRQSQKLAEVLAHYTARLPTHVLVPKLLQFGQTLRDRKEYRLAADSVYTYVLGQSLLNAMQHQGGRLDEDTRISCHVQAVVGLCICNTELTTQEDPSIHHPDTFKALMDELRRCKAAVLTAVQSEALCWLVVQGTVEIFNVALKLMTAGYPAEVLEYLCFSTEVLQSHVTFDSWEHIPWRTQLYCTSVACYLDCGLFESALQLVLDGLSKIEGLIKLQELDPVPPPPELTTAYKKGILRLNMLKLQLHAAQGGDGLKAMITETLPSDNERILVLAEALRLPSQRVVRHQLPPAALINVVELVKGLAQPYILQISAGQPTHSTTDKAPEPAADVADQPEAQADANAQQDAQYQAASAALSLEVHQALLCAAYQFEQWDFFEALAAAAQVRVQLSAQEPIVGALGAVAGVLTALRQLDKSPGADSLKNLAAILQSTAATGAAGCRDILTDAALVLHASSKPLLDGVHCCRDREAVLATTILHCLHSVFHAVQLDDGVLLLTLDMKLALLLHESGDIYTARDILYKAKQSAELFRSEALAATRYAKDEPLRWISGSRSQPQEAAAGSVAGMTSTEQQLACLHTDLLALLFRVELETGVAEQQAAASKRQTKVVNSLSRRDEQATIFGSRTMKERRLDEARVQQAASVPPNPPSKERDLRVMCGKNPYWRALLALQMVGFQGDRARQLLLMQEAAEQLQQAQAMEDALFAAAQAPGSGHAKRESPPQPQILCRTPTSVTLTHFPLHLKGRTQPAKFAAYCKSVGAGVAISINRTAMEYPGTGEMKAVGERVTVQGLRSNDTYVLALAAYDASGALIGSLGESSPEVIIALPLPLYYCWAHLALTAARLGLWPQAHRAHQVLSEHFIVSTPDRPLWEANPMDAQTLNRKHVETATAALLRAFAQCSYAAAANAQSLREVAVPLGFAAALAGKGHHTAAGHQLCKPYLDQQVALLKTARQLLIAMEVSALIGDEMLVEEGAVRAYHVLAPLMASQDKSPALHKALAHLHLTLQDVRNLVQDSQEGQEQQRCLGARVTAAAAYYLMQLGSTEPKATDVFGKLDIALLNAYDPLVETPGRPQQSALLTEVDAAHEAALSHPRLEGFQSQALAARSKNESDLVAAVLPLLRGDNPMSAWAVLDTDAARQHDRWLELGVRMLDAAIRSGVTTGVPAAAEAVLQLFRQRSRSYHPEFPKWKLEEAAAAIEGTMPAELEPPPRVLDGLTPEERTQAAAEHQAAKEEAVTMWRRREAAAVLLQQRLPKMLLAQRALRKLRQAQPSRCMWMARLHVLLGLAATAEAKLFLAAKKAEAARPPEPVQPPPTSPTGKKDGKSPSRPASPAKSPSRPVSPTKGAERPGSAAKGPKGKAAAAAAVPEAPPVNPEAPLEAVAHLARASTLARRAGSAPEQLGATAHLFNTMCTLLNADEELTLPLQPCTWGEGLWAPPPPVPPPEPPAATPLDSKAKGGKGGKPDPKVAAKPAPKKPEPKKGGKDATMAEGPAPRNVPVPQNCKPNLARYIKSSLLALMSLVGDMRCGVEVFPGVVPLGAGSGPQDRPDTAHSKYAPSNFSLGSDQPVVRWFQQQSAVDMEWSTQLVDRSLVALGRMRRWKTVMELGKLWMELTDGAFNELLLPHLLNAAPYASADLAPLQVALDVVVRDKKQVVDQLDKLRASVRERLGEPPLLAAGPTHKAKKKRRTAVGSSRGSTPGNGFSKTGSFRDTSSLASYRTAGTGRTKASQPDHVRYPADYEKAIEALKKRGEKALMTQAINELGDVYAHFGMWTQATSTWNEGLDTLVGPYQVLKDWRTALEPLSPRQGLEKYSVHGLLLAGGIMLGKLARYCYFDNLGPQLEAARMGAVLLRGVFAGSMVHPQRLLGFATHLPREIWERVSLFNDSYRCNLADLVSGVETIAMLLVDYELALEALPVLALWDHLVTFATRNLHAVVLCRLVRARALTQLGLVAESSALLLDLMAGRRLPDATLDTDHVLKLADGTPLKVPPVAPLTASQLPGHSSNKACATHLAEAQLPEAVAKLYGPWLVAHLSMARAGLLMALGGTPNCWKNTDPTTGAAVSPASPLPEAIEAALLERSLALLQPVIDAARPIVTPEAVKAPPPPAVADGKKGGAADKKAAASAPAKGGKAAPAAVPAFPVVADADAVAGLSASQAADVLPRSLLLLSQAQELRWEPEAGLQAATESLSALSAVAGKVSGLMDGNDDTQRMAPSARHWLAARRQGARLCLQLGRRDSCRRWLDAGLLEARQSKDALLSARLLHVKAGLSASDGLTAEALNLYQDVAARYRRLGVRGLWLAEALLDAGDLRDQLGLRADSAQLHADALDLLQEHTSALGLREMQEHPELLSVYTPATPMYLEALVRCARAAARRRELRAAEQQLRQAQRLLPFTRSLPIGHARLALALATVQRNIVMTDDGSPGNRQADLEQAGQRLNAARAGLLQSATWAALDGGHDWATLRDALLESGSSLAATLDAAPLAACLRAAQGVALRRDVLMCSTHTLQASPCGAAALPPWLINLLKGREQAALAMQGKPADAVQLTDANLTRLLLCHYVGLIKAPPPTGVTDTSRMWAQRLQIHTLLKSACAKYAADCCLPAPPLPLADAPAPASGSIVVQWYQQDGCWQEAASWSASGALQSGDVTDATVLALRAPTSYASMLYCIQPPAAAGTAAAPPVICGELTFPTAEVHATLHAVKQMRLHTEAPRGETDVYGALPPAPAEHDALQRRLGRFLRRIPDDADEAADGDVAGQTLEVSLALLVKLEALLTLDGGADIVDAPLAAWLSSQLAR